MTLIVKETGSNFIPAPEGVHVAVCVDVVDLGKRQVTFENKTKVLDQLDIRWQIEAQMESGDPFLASCRYTKSLHEKSKLREHLQTWRGKRFTKTELEGFDVEAVIGKCCQLSIQHKVRPDESVFARVTAVMALAKGMAGIDPTEGYVRQKDREQANGETEPQISDEDIPF